MVGHGVQCGTLTALVHPERPRERRGDEAGVADITEGDEDHAVGESVARGLGRREGKARLADARGADKGQQAHVVAAQQVRHGRDLTFAPDQRREQRGQAGRRVSEGARDGRMVRPRGAGGALGVAGGARAVARRDGSCERGALGLREREGVGQARDRVVLRRLDDPALDVADDARGEGRPLGQRLL